MAKKVYFNDSVMFRIDALAKKKFKYLCAQKHTTESKFLRKHIKKIVKLKPYIAGKFMPAEKKKNRSNIIIPIDRETKDKFKYICYQNQIAMSDDLKEYIKRTVKNVTIPKHFTSK